MYNPHRVIADVSGWDDIPEWVNTLAQAIALRRFNNYTADDLENRWRWAMNNAALCHAFATVLTDHGGFPAIVIECQVNQYTWCKDAQVSRDMYDLRKNDARMTERSNHPGGKALN